MERQQVIVRFPAELLAEVDELVESSRAFSSRNDAIVGVMASWCRQVRSARGVAVRERARVALVCPDKRCVPPRRSFGDAGWVCPEHGKAARQEEVVDAPVVD